MALKTTMNWWLQLDYYSMTGKMLPSIQKELKFCIPQAWFLSSRLSRGLDIMEPRVHEPFCPCFASLVRQYLRIKEQVNSMCPKWYGCCYLHSCEILDEIYEMTGGNDVIIFMVSIDFTCHTLVKPSYQSWSVLMGLKSTVNKSLPLDMVCIISKITVSTGLRWFREHTECRLVVIPTWVEKGFKI